MAASRHESVRGRGCGAQASPFAVLTMWWCWWLNVIPQHSLLRRPPLSALFAPIAPTQRRVTRKSHAVPPPARLSRPSTPLQPIIHRPINPRATADERVSTSKQAGWAGRIPLALHRHVRSPSQARAPDAGLGSPGEPVGPCFLIRLVGCARRMPGPCRTCARRRRGCEGEDKGGPSKADLSRVAVRYGTVPHRISLNMQSWRVRPRASTEVNRRRSIPGGWGQKHHGTDRALARSSSRAAGTAALQRGLVPVCMVACASLQCPGTRRQTRAGRYGLGLVVRPSRGRSLQRQVAG